MRRYLTIEKYRNIGLDRTETLLLNSSLDKGEEGNLVILVGENNSGKSNVLDALKSFGGQSISSRDVTNLEFDPWYHKPRIYLVSEVSKHEYAYGVNSGGTGYSFDRSELSDLMSKEDVIYLCGALANDVSYLGQLKIRLESPSVSDDEVRAIKGILYDYLKNRYTRTQNPQDDQILTWVHNHYMRVYGSFSVSQETKLKEYGEKCGLTLTPSVVVYQEKQISDEALKTSPDSINFFIASVLDNIGFSSAAVTNAYQMYRSQSNGGILTKLEKEMNEKVQSVADKFNAIYKLDDNSYKFAFRAESSELSLTIFKNDEPLTLSYQSTGFRWFFNLYFNLLTKATLKRGDIIIMDEPATHLHVQGQKELRAFLKEFAINNGVTLVIATHSPFLIDIKHLDEVRIIRNVNGRTYIENNFAAIDANNSDTLSSVLDALTVNAHVLCDPDKQLVFVEGITDYNFYTKAAQLLGDKYANLIFLPVNGIGNDKDMQREILKRIMTIGRKRDPILLVDGDKPGASIKKLNGDNKDLTIISLADIDPTFSEVEVLFTDEDRKKFHIEKVGGGYVKSAALSSRIKCYRTEADFSEDTLTNFRRVLDSILEEIS